MLFGTGKDKFAEHSACSVLRLTIKDYDRIYLDIEDVELFETTKKGIVDLNLKGIASQEKRLSILKTKL